MTEQQFIELASRYVSGVATAEEIERIDALLKEHRYAELFRKVNSTWLNAGRAVRKKKFDTDRGLDRLAEKLRRHEPAFRWGPNRRRFPASVTAPMYYGIAASIAVILLLAAVRIYQLDTQRQKEALAWVERSARMGEKAVVVLPDGSTITLNGGSRIKYPAQFDNRPRSVFLDGEAYFEIKHDDAHPLIVHAGTVSATDLGTTFTVCAFASDSTIAVSLEAGSVEVSERGAAAQPRGVVLSPLQQFVLNRHNGYSRIRAFDPQRVSGWKDNLYVFDDAPLSVVFTELERGYGVKFELDDSAALQRRIRANFRNASVWAVAEVLKKATGFSYHALHEQHTLTTIVFTKN